MGSGGDSAVTHSNLVFKRRGGGGYKILGFKFKGMGEQRILALESK